MDIYEALGLTEGEKKVYKALLKLRSSTTGPIFKQASISQSKVYEVLDRLKKKGLAASIIKQGRTYWHPANPSIYMERLSQDLLSLNERRLALEQGLPKLLKEETYPSDEAQVLIGYNGFRSCLWSFLDSFKKQDTMHVIGSPVPIPDPFFTFLKAFNIERVKRDIHARFLYGESLESFARSIYSLPKTELRIMKGLTPSTIAIGDDRIIIMTWEEGGKCIVITGKSIAKNYRAFFDSLWRMAR
ncbi:MAG: helix-turn-helix domain-containing protein [Nanoarchaeota archaeon]